jgi:plasmid stability protein
VAQVVIRNIDEDAMRRLRFRAARKGVSLERELRAILTEAARRDRTGFRERAAAFRRKLAGRRRHSDSTALIRKDRSRARFVTADQRLLRRAGSLRPGTALVDLRSLDT